MTVGILRCDIPEKFQAKDTLYMFPRGGQWEAGKHNLDRLGTRVSAAKSSHGQFNT